jgi:putative hydrolase of the HAD superfamily
VPYKGDASRQSHGVRAVAFDYYFTLADPDAPPAREAAVRCAESLDHDALREAWRDLRTPDVAGALTGKLPAFELYGLRWERQGAELFARLGVAADGTVWRTCREAAHAHAPLYTDVAPALAVLDRAGLASAVVSDADTAWLAASIQRNQLRVDVVLSSQDVGCYKPHESLFRTACSRLGIAPSAAVYVGDSPHFDVVGARNAGLTPIWINRAGVDYPSDLEPPDHTITTLAELPELLDVLP